MRRGAAEPRATRFSTPRLAALPLPAPRAVALATHQRALTLTQHALRAAPHARSMQIIEPKAPLALRLAAVLMRGVVALYNRQLYFLHGA